MFHKAERTYFSRKTISLKVSKRRKQIMYSTEAQIYLQRNKIPPSNILVFFYHKLQGDPQTWEDCKKLIQFLFLHIYC